MSDLLFDIHDKQTVTPNTIQFVVLGRPQQCGSKVPMRLKDGSFFVADSNDKYRLPWMQEVRIMATLAMRELGISELIDAPVSIDVDFFFARPDGHYGTGKNAGRLTRRAPRLHAQSPDTDKLCRCLGDSLTGSCIRDDRQIFRWLATRHWTTDGERTEVVITTHGDKK